MAYGDELDLNAAPIRINAVTIPIRTICS